MERCTTFFLRRSSIWGLKTCLNTKTDLEKNKTAMIPDEESHGLEVHNENHAGKRNGLLFIFFPTSLG